MMWPSGSASDIERLGKVPASSRNGEHLVAQQPLDRENRLNIFGTITALAAVCPVWVEECLELAFPITQGMHLDACDPAGNADAYRLIHLLPLLGRHALFVAP